MSRDAGRDRTESPPLELSPAQKRIVKGLWKVHGRGGEPAKSEDVAEEVDRDSGTIRNQMQSLKALKLVEGVPGPRGGYRLTSHGEEVAEALQPSEKTPQRNIEAHTTTSPHISTKSDTSALLEDPSDPIEHIIISDPGVIPPLVDLLDAGDTSPNILLEQSVKDWLSETYYIRSRLREVTRGTDVTLSVSRKQDGVMPEVVITSDEVYFQLKLGEWERFLRSDGDIYEAILEGTNLLFDSSRELKLDIPTWEEVKSELSEVVNLDTSQEFQRVFDELPADELHDVDEVKIALICAARTGALLYDVGKWGEDMGVGSKATFSRSKSKLENDGVISTEKVPVQVGRPRLRLNLNEAALNSYDSVGGVKPEILSNRVTSSPRTTETNVLEDIQDEF